jgi:hypothetical protein
MFHVITGRGRHRICRSIIGANANTRTGILDYITISCIVGATTNICASVPHKHAFTGRATIIVQGNVKLTGQNAIHTFQTPTPVKGHPLSDADILRRHLDNLRSPHSQTHDLNETIQALYVCITIYYIPINHVYRNRVDLKMQRQNLNFYHRPLCIYRII